MRILLLSLIALGPLACGGKPMPRMTPERLVIYPQPPDTARIQFLLRFSNSTQVEPPPSSSFFQTLTGGGETPEVRRIFKPYGVAIHEGVIYVCDTRLGIIEAVDISNKTFEYLPLGGMAAVREPTNCFMDDDGLLYVADVGRREIVVLDGTEYRGSVGTDIVGRPGDVVVRNDRIWVSSLSTRKVHVFDKTTRELLYELPDYEPGMREALATPVNIAVDDEHVYVSDLIPARINVYTHDGEYVRSIGKRGTNIGELGRPKGIAVDRDGVIYVVDASFHVVQLFNSEGQILMFFGGPYKEPGDMSLPAKVIIDYDNVEYFREYVDPQFDLKYLIIVTNQFGPDQVNVYGFVEPKVPSTEND